MQKSLSVIDKIFLIRQIPAFRHLNWLDLHFIANQTTFVEYEKGECIYQKGDPPDAFYCVVSGRLSAYTSQSGKKEIIEYIYKGMHFGIISLLTGEPHSLSFEALNDSVLLRIPQENFSEILKKIPRIGVDLSYSLSRRVKNLEHQKKAIFESTIISVYSPLRKTGSSFYALHLAFELKNATAKNVLFVNMESASTTEGQEGRGHPSFRWKLPPVDFFMISQNPEKALSCIEKSKEDVPDFLNVYFDLDQEHFTKHVSRFVSNLANDYHYIILDLPNQMDRFVFSSLTQSDEVHLIVREDKEELKALVSLLDDLKSSFKKDIITDKVKIFIKEQEKQKSITYDRINRIIDYDIYGKLPFIEESDITQVFDSPRLNSSLAPQQHPFVQAMRKTAREIGGVRVGLVLGGGGALGFSHIGVLDVLEKENIAIDMIVGSSVGSILAGFWALGYNAKQIEEWAKEFRSRSKCLSLLDVIFPRSGLIAGWSIQRWLRQKIGKAIFYEAKIPLKIVAFDIRKREEVVLNGGDIVSALRKSISIPGVMRPVVCDDQILVDGGIFNPLPTNVLTSLGVRKIIAVNILKSPADVRLDQEKQSQKNLKQKILSPNIFDILVHSFLTLDYILAEQRSQQADVLIHPDSAGVDWYELYKAEELIEKGRQAAYAALADIKQLIKS